MLWCLVCVSARACVRTSLGMAKSEVAHLMKCNHRNLVKLFGLVETDQMYAISAFVSVTSRHAYPYTCLQYALLHCQIVKSKVFVFVFAFCFSDSFNDSIISFLYVQKVPMSKLKFVTLHYVTSHYVTLRKGCWF